jgi:hypothetical protein
MVDIVFYVYVYFDPSVAILYENEFFISELQPMYVGKGVGERYKKHLRNNPDNRDFNLRIKYLQENKTEIPISIIYESTDEQDVFNVEEILIEKIGRRILGTGPLYNITKGGAGGYSPTKETREKIGTGNRGKKVSDETKVKMSLAAKGRPVTEEKKQKISNSLKGNIPWNKGKTGIYTKETLDKMRNKVFTAESRNKMSESQKGKKHSAEHNRKNSESNKGRIISEETKRKMSVAKKEYWDNKKEKNDN